MIVQAMMWALAASGWVAPAWDVLMIPTLWAPWSFNIMVWLTSTVDFTFAATWWNCYSITTDASWNAIWPSDTVNKIIFYSWLTSTVTNSFASASVPTWVTVIGWNLVSSNHTSTDQIYVHSWLTSTVTTTYAAPWTLQTWIGRDDTNTNLLSSNRWQDDIYLYVWTDVTNITSSIQAPATDCTWCDMDSDWNLWTSDIWTNSYYKHSGFTTTILSTTAAPSWTLYDFWINK
jgi:hypothetical protein